MLYWDMKWNSFEGEFSDLEVSQRLNVALACLESVLVKDVGYFYLSLTEDQKILINTALDILWGNNSTEDKGVIAEKLSEQTELDNKPGFYDLLMGVLLLLNADDGLTADDTLEVMSYIYQSILDREIISQLIRDTLESEVQVMERNNQRCLCVVDEQIQYLKNVKKGHLIKRQEVLLDRV